MNYHSVMLLKKSVVNCIKEETQPKVRTYRSIHRYMCVCVWCVSVCGVCGVVCVWVCVGCVCACVVWVQM